VLLAASVSAREPKISGDVKQNRLQMKAEGCAPATAVASLEFNNVRARIENGGNMWQDRTRNVSAYEVPKNSGIRSIFAGALWMGGLSPSGQLKLAAVTFRNRGNDFWPGPLTNDGLANADPVVCADWDKFFKASKADAIRHRAWAEAKLAGMAEELFPGYAPPNYFNEWPAQIALPDYDQNLAPFNDFDGDGIYNPSEGDAPDYALTAGPLDCREATRSVPLFGDTTIYWIFNDKGNIHTETGGDPIGMEIRAQAFAFADKSAINNMTFYNYVLINQGTQRLENTYFGQWADADLGFSDDDRVGCDVSRGLGFCYNGDNDDDVSGGGQRGYGLTPPAVGIDFFQGPFQDPDGLDNIGPYDENLAPAGKVGPISYEEATAGKGIPYLGLGIGYGDGFPDNERFGMRKFVYYNRGDLSPSPNTADPSDAGDYYGYLQGRWKDDRRFVYGGDAYQKAGACPEGVVSPTAFCDFMFPGDSDPLNFGSLGVDYGCLWDETEAGNNPGDRRFMQSAGPFTLTPGQVNNITVGIVWARAQTGDANASVIELKKADDLAQGLFDNCFQLFEGPDAPDLSITELDRELVLTLSNPQTSNNFNESYKKVRPEIPVNFDRDYNFEGYLIYQVSDPTVSPAELRDQSKAKLIFQCDIRNFEKDSAGRDLLNRPISDLINYNNGPLSKLPEPELMVKGSNSGLIRAIRVKEDAFSTARDRTIINNKPYYFVAIAYAQNNWQTFNPVTLVGQTEVFVSSRKNGRAGAIVPVAAIPHIITPENGGTILNSSFGEGLVVTRHEGTGNGGFFVDIDPLSEEEILANGRADNITYKRGFSPVGVKVVDPLKVRDTEWELRFIPDEQNRANAATWVLTDKNMDEKGDIRSYKSDKAINAGGGEQLILQEGISVRIAQVSYFTEGSNQKTEPIGAELVFEENPNDQWLSGVPDRDGPVLQNWIRAGNLTGVSNGQNDYSINADFNQSYEKLLNGTWTAFALGSDTSLGPLNPDVSETARNQRNTELARTVSVDIVFTSDKSKWTRVPVLEMCDVADFAQGNAQKGRLRKAPSVDKNGLNVFQGGTSLEATFDGDSGMSWFPGYAINVETGERLNMAFGENSFLAGENGRDMIWNPTSRLSAGFPGNEEYLFGGMHYIFVFRNDRFAGANNVGPNDPTADNFVPSYDQAGMMARAFRSGDRNRIRNVWRGCSWIGLPLLTPTYSYKPMTEGFIPSKARVKLRVNKPYQHYPVGDLTYSDSASTPGLMNKLFPIYTISAKGYQALKNQAEVAKNALDIVRAVPNPYYAFSQYEAGRLDNRIKITNLPNSCTISIYTVDGTLVRQFKKDNTLTFIEWDLKNFGNIPVSSGAYLIHIDAPGIGEKVVKWFGVMRQVDLQSL
ncbi:MAG TPA: T9SS C-terminal target domain-containing protein, partial [Luteibaculaceae bacterium]|nr:T9SS C-terminal target domain-containing protein [Luteibaculaceae bacterium]